jgi:hypothetical protein
VRLHFLLLGFVFLSLGRLSAVAQPADSTVSSVQPAVSASETHQGYIATAAPDSKGWSSSSSFCELSGGRRRIPSYAIVFVVRRTECPPRYAGIINTLHYDVLYKGELWVLPGSALVMRIGTLEEVHAVSPTLVKESLAAWKRMSLAATLDQRKDALDAIKGTARDGVALLKSSIYDVSEHTEGTGFSFRLHNSGKKIIKYATATVIGYNAVKDPVRDRLRGASALTFRGIGPIAPDETASYQKDYFWMTDVVESHRILEIKLEFTDGTSRTIKDIDRIRIKAAHYAMIFEEE